MRKKRKKLSAFLLLAFAAGCGLMWLVLTKAPEIKELAGRAGRYVERALSRERGAGMAPPSVSVRFPPLPKRPDVFPVEPEKPRLAIVIDDLGPNPSLTAEAIRLPAAVTLSFFPYGPEIGDQVRRAHDAGHEVLLHMPMEPLGSADPGPGALTTNLQPGEIKARLEKALAGFSGYDGVNNHMGSKFTTDRARMAVVMETLGERGLYFLDSRTNPASAGETIARESGVLAASRHVFLDNDVKPEAVRDKLQQAIALARRDGSAIAIGHPHPAVLKVLAAELFELENQGVVLAPVRDLVH